MKYFKKILLLWLLAYSSMLHATEEEWYVLFALGGARHIYQEPLNSRMNQMEQSNSGSRSQISIDTIGIYRNLHSKNLIAGFIASGTGDAASNSNTKDIIATNQILYGGSVIQSFGREPGLSFFLKFDAGLAVQLYAESVNNIENSSLKFGPGITPAAGFGIPVTEGARLLLYLGFPYKFFDLASYGAFIVNLGILW